jgi:hypothetical protein
MTEPQNDTITPDDDQTAADNRGKRAGKASGEVTGSGADSGGSGNPEDYDDDPVGGGGSFPPAGPPPGKGRDAPEGGMR